MWLGKQGYSQVTADCDFTPLVSGEELIQKPPILLRVGSGPRYSHYIQTHPSFYILMKYLNA